MIMVLSEAAEHRFTELAGDTARDPGKPVDGLTVQVHHDELLVRIGLVDDSFPPPIAGIQSTPCYIIAPGFKGAPSPSKPFINVCLSKTEALTAQYHPEAATNVVDCEIEVIRLEADVFNRVQGILDTSILNPMTVAVFGLGSGGSVIALELAKAGTGNFVLTDFDRLKAHNIARHVCGLSDVGRFKTQAVRDAILQHNPRATVTCYETDVTQDTELLYEAVRDCDVVVVATDTELSRNLINEACLDLGAVAVYGGAYERAFAGEVVRVVPDSGGCYACVRQRTASMIRSLSSQQSFDYTDDEEFQAEPGLGLDVAFIALLQAKVALMTLLRGTDSSVGDIDAQMIIWTNTARPEDGKLFAEPMARYFVSVSKSPDCPACGEITESDPDAPAP
jgi:molybdopterin/thiamine biosynthesis adenylyltransferase